MIEALKASPSTIEDLLKQDKYQYIIPPYQRPYAWGIEQVETLWNDIITYVDTGDQPYYFLGNIVRIDDNGATPYKTYTIVDGQQRLTSIFLLLKAIYLNAKTYSPVQRCLWFHDEAFGGGSNRVITSQKLESRVLGEGEKIALEHVLNIEFIKELNGKNHYVENIQFFHDAIIEWVRNNPGDESLKSLIDTILTKLVLLPIDCKNQEHALTIFQTLNNRGMTLNDSDIFKAELYKDAGKEGKSVEFIERWDGLVGDDSNAKVPMDAFRRYMYILRGKENNVDTTAIGMRKFFESGRRLSSLGWEEVMRSLEKIRGVSVFLAQDYASRWVDCFYISPTTSEIWEYPIYAFLYKTLEYNDGQWILDDKHKLFFEALCKNVLRYMLISYLGGSTQNNMRGSIYKATNDIITNDGKTYIDTLKKYTEDKWRRAEDNINTSDFGYFSKSVLSILAYVNPKQKERLPSVEKMSKEHILPQQFNHYDGWTKETHDVDRNTLGNLLLCERKMNSKASNEYFDRKKEVYRQSAIEEVKELCATPRWTPEILAERNAIKTKVLLDFFKAYDK